ncbi:MAG: hypothetical protein HZA93_13115 [Verrucomicrobia bacterium]|nr:hypothetical protein [Verrucomicrobiota bacterium]
MNNADFIAAHQARLSARSQAPGMAAAATEVLLTCPCCGTTNFSSRGLTAHCCRAKPNRERLTPAELALARQRARAS